MSMEARLRWGIRWVLQVGESSDMRHTSSVEEVAVLLLPRSASALVKGWRSS